MILIKQLLLDRIAPPQSSQASLSMKYGILKDTNVASS